MKGIPQDSTITDKIKLLEHFSTMIFKFKDFWTIWRLKEAQYNFALLYFLIQLWCQRNPLTLIVAHAFLKN